MKKILSIIVQKQKLLIPLLLAFILMYPFIFKSPYQLRMATLSGVYIILALSLNLLIGVTGQISIGHAAFFGIGAYTSAILATRFGTGFVVTFILAGVIAGIFGFILGMPALKIKGYYLAIVTLGFCEIIRIIEMNWMSLTRGPLGISGIPPINIFGLLVDDEIEYYYLIFVMILVSYILLKNILNSRIGRGFLAIKENEIAAESMGINLFKYKVLSFTVSSVFAGCVGAFFAHYMTFIDPTIFTSEQSTLILVMVIFGGLGSLPGAVIGAIGITILPEVLRGFAQYRQIIYGFALIVMMLNMPNGLLGKVNLKHIQQRINFNKAGESNE